MHAPQVRPFRRYHLSRILRIERTSFASEAYSKAMFLQLYRDCGDLFFVARQSGRIAGYMVTCRAGDRAEIISIAVDPAYRRYGVASALIEHTLKRLRALRVRAVDLTVRPHNLAAITLYRSFGFARLRRVKGYYEDGGDAIRMRKVVKE